MFWVISVYFNIRNTLLKVCPFLLGRPVYTQRVLEIQPPRSPDPNPLDVYLCLYLQPLGNSAQIENEESLRQRIFEARKTIRNRPGTFQRV